LELVMVSIMPMVPLKCPSCGDQDFCGIFPAIEGVAPERVLCKWCGYYYSEENGELQCEPNAEKGYWDVRVGEAKYPTPKELSDLEQRGAA
jgi:hypothetical protein